MTTTKPKRRITVIQVVYDLRYGGSERLASFLSYGADRSKYKTGVLSLYGAGPVSVELGVHGVPFYVLTDKRQPIGRWSLQRRILEFLRENRVDILQVHGAYPLTRVAPLCKMTKTKLIYTEHAKRSLQSSRRLRGLTKIAAAFSDRIVLVSEDLKRYFQDGLNTDSKKLTVIHNGVDLEKFQPGRTDVSVPGLPEKPKGMIYVGLVGRLTDAKDHMGFIEALMQIVKTGERIKAIIIGDGELREALQAKVRDYNLTDSVAFLGQRDDIPEITSQMDVMVLPSKREGFPISLLESMAMGKPVIATQVGGVSEIIQHNVNGYLIPPRDVSALIEALEGFVENRDHFLQMARVGRKTIVDRFSDAIVKKAYGQLYEEVFLKGALRR